MSNNKNELKQKKLNLFNYEFRIGWYYVPLNTVLLQEDFFGETVMVKDSGLRFLFGRGQARKIRNEDDYTFDFKEQKIDGENRMDIFLDFSVDYQLGAGLKDEELDEIKTKNAGSDVIKSLGKNLHRANIFKLFLRSEGSLEKPMEQILMNIVRRHLTNKSFDDVQNIDKGKDNELEKIKNEYYLECLAKLGVEVIDLRVSNIHLAQDVNKLYNQKEIAEQEKNIKKTVAEGDAEAARIRAEGEKQAEIIKAQAEAEKIKTIETAKAAMDATRIDMLSGNDYKTILATTSPENMNRISEKTVNLVGVDALIDKIAKDVYNSMKAKEDAKTVDSAKSNDNAVDMGSDVPAADYDDSLNTTSSDVQHYSNNISDISDSDLYLEGNISSKEIPLTNEELTENSFGHKPL